MSVTRLILILFLIITGIIQVQAVSYCASPFTASNASITLNLTCKQTDATHYVYQLDFSAAVTIPLYNPNIGVNTSSGPFILNNANLVASNGNKTLSWTITSTSTPTLFVNDLAVYVGGVFGTWSLPTSADFTAVCSTTPTANAGLPQSVCKNASFTLGGSPSTALNGTAPYTYSWASNPASFSSTLANPTASSTTTTTYTVTVTDKNSATATSSVLITITTIAAAPTVSYNSPLQTGQTLNLSCSAYSSYNWTGPSSFTSTLENPTKTNMLAGNFGTYTVSVTDAYGCTNTGSVLVSIHTPATYYINDNSTAGDSWCTAVGSDASGTGSTSQPYATLNYLLSHNTLYGGDKVYIDNGSYSWATVDFSSGDDRGSSTSQLVINGAGATKTLITANAGVNGFYSNTTTNNYITFQNLSITATSNAFNWVSPVSINILNCNITSNFAGGAINFSTSSNKNTISGNTISQTNTAGYGIYFQGSPHKYNTISKNIIKGVSGSEPLYGIYFQTGTTNNLIVNNFIANFKYGLYQSTNYSTKLYNNSFYCNKYCFRGVLDSMDIRNNIFYTYGNTTPPNNYCIVTSFPPNTDIETTIIDYNIYYHPNANAYCVGFYNSTYNWTFDIDWQGYYWITNSDANSFELDPLYKAPTSSDLHLISALSPAINVGVTIPSVTDDIDFGTRPFGAAYDIGADEYGSSILPVKLISFDAFCMDGSVKINWATATETNNNYFILEKSIDAENFIPLAQIKGAGNSNKLLNYSFIDYESLPGNQYYRLTQVDYNGQKEIFNVKNIECNQNHADSFKAYSIDKEIYVTINSSSIEKFYLQLFDISGRLVYSEIKQLDGNIFTIQIPTTQFSKGIYILKLYNFHTNFQQKIFIK